MQRLPKCISTAALILLAFSTAQAEELQWVHSSQQKATKTPAVATRTQRAPRRSQQVEIIHLPAKQPSFRQPEQFRQPAAAKPLQQPVRTAEARPAAPAIEPGTPRTYRVPATKQVMPAQHEEYEEIQPYESMPAGIVESGPVCDCEECQMGGSMYAGEVGCGFPEPGCACQGPCGCGDGCYLGDPGCAVGYGDVGYVGPSCGVGCSDGCCGDCVEGCCTCGDACCEPSCGCGDSCDGDCQHWPQALFGCDDRGCVPILWLPPIKEITFFGGVHGFKNPLDGNRDGGNFGFHEGFNIGGKMAWLPWPGLGYQFGYQATHSQLSGDSDTATDGAHSQHFVTTGLFHRNRLGLQYGVVWDMMRDERQGANDFGQVRGQIGFKNCTSREFGFLFSANSNDNQINAATFQAADQYLFYYRILGRQGGDCRLLAGFSDDSNPILGSDFHLPLNDRWSLEGNWRYLIPEGGNNGSGAHDEGWNLGMNLVWHYGFRAKTWNNRPYRPMFNVANNSSLIVVD